MPAVHSTAERDLNAPPPSGVVSAPVDPRGLQVITTVHVGTHGRPPRAVERFRASHVCVSRPSVVGVALPPADRAEGGGDRSLEGQRRSASPECSRFWGGPFAN
jgi:hypothetical protein